MHCSAERGSGVYRDGSVHRVSSCFSISEAIVVVRQSKHRCPGLSVRHLLRQCAHFCGAVAPMFGVVHLGLGHDCAPCCRTPQPLLFGG